jgi:hypothetical protein
MIDYYFYFFRRTKSLPRSRGGQRRGSSGSFSDLAGLELFSSYQRPQGQQEEVRLRRRPTPETCLENSELYLNALSASREIANLNRKRNFDRYFNVIF